MAAIIANPLDFNVDDLYVDLRQSIGCRLYLKCEGFNFAGSIKIKAAAEMVGAMERSGELRPGGTLVESSSGNMGVALSVVAASRGYRFVCVTDVRCTLTARRAMEALGSEVHVITEPDAEGGFLGARLARVARLCDENEGYLWLNQYANPGNWRGHYRTTGPEIAKAFPDVEVVFIGAGTTGTLMGCARYFRENRPEVTIVAVDTVGSVTFGRPSGRRLIPGLGTSVRPPILDASYADDVVYVTEPETVRTCRRLVRHGFLFGGSTGTVVAGARDWLARNAAHGTATAVAIAPDLGGNYLDTVYDEEWVARAFGADVTADVTADVAADVAADV
ncbi:2,3-diaminopropionate biosynthesis protein SbnA [Kitasatospora sp. NPDC002551]|uniref:2,3-diaminopropionate biosynthesis protein SbnA n=1 Tax=Kitasatospora sp. NPDC002551 TaxID=3154539 RepID=UPI00331E5413